MVSTGSQMFIQKPDRPCHPAQVAEGRDVAQIHSDVMLAGDAAVDQALMQAAGAALGDQQICISMEKVKRGIVGRGVGRWRGLRIDFRVVGPFASQPVNQRGLRHHRPRQIHRAHHRQSRLGLACCIDSTRLHRWVRDCLGHPSCPAWRPGDRRQNNQRPQFARGSILYCFALARIQRTACLQSWT